MMVADAGAPKARESGGTPPWPGSWVIMMFTSLRHRRIRRTTSTAGSINFKIYVRPDIYRTHCKEVTGTEYKFSLFNDDVFERRRGVNEFSSRSYNSGTTRYPTPATGPVLLIVCCRTLVSTAGRSQALDPKIFLPTALRLWRSADWGSRTLYSRRRNLSGVACYRNWPRSR